MPYIVASSPHWNEPSSVRRIMADVVIALCPAFAWAAFAYGYRAPLVVVVCVAAATLSEAACRRLMGRDLAIDDGSAVVTGALLAAVLPANIPFWFAALGAAFAIVIGKQVFGGLGANIWNPALLARAAMQVSMPGHMIAARWPWLSFADGRAAAGAATDWTGNPARSFAGTFAELNAKAAQPADAILSATMPLHANPGVPASGYDLITAATSMKTVHYPVLEAGLDPAAALPPALTPTWTDVARAWLGAEGGCLGEVAAGLLLLGGLYLLWRNVISWRIPAAYLATVALCVFALPMPVVHGGDQVAYRFAGSWTLLLLHLGGGGVMLGAFFMATDYVTSPLTPSGKIVFGAGCGLLTMVIRLYGGYPEGVCYAILLMNTAVPLIDRFTRPRVFGTGGKKEPECRAA